MKAISQQTVFLEKTPSHHLSQPSENMGTFSREELASMD